MDLLVPPQLEDSAGELRARLPVDKKTFQTGDDRQTKKGGKLE